ncbi:hypothetical protein GCM10028812_44060 [Ancylobacter sonchi]
MKAMISRSWLRQNDTIRMWSIGLGLCGIAAGLVYAAVPKQDRTPMADSAASERMASVLPDPVELNRLFAEIEERGAPRIVASPARAATASSMAILADAAAPTKTEIKRQPVKKTTVTTSAIERFDRCSTMCETRDPLVIARIRSPLPPTPPVPPVADTAQRPNPEAELTGGQLVLAGGRYALGQLADAPRTTLAIGQSALSRMASAIW